jgi:hypothetical protein
MTIRNGRGSIGAKSLTSPGQMFAVTNYVPRLDTEHHWRLWYSRGERFPLTYPRPRKRIGIGSAITYQAKEPSLSMSWLLDIRLIRFFSFYLAVMFLLSTWMRLRQYGTVLGLVRGMPNRWPRLLELVKQHIHIFLTWGTVLPLLLLLIIFALNYLASQWLWTSADEFTVRELGNMYLAWPAVLVLGAAMTAFDVWGVVSVSSIDRVEMEKYFDQAEYWLCSWTAPVVHFFTLGRINPRQMVAVEVRTALLSSSRLLNSTLWWVVTQAGLRIAFGLSLWLSYALKSWL